MKDIESIPFFDHFEGESLKTVSRLFKLKEFTSGEEILEQDSFNTEILFLLKGSVQIHVDGEFVVTIKEPGAVFGEMSIAGHTTCTATLIANEDCHFAVIDFQRIQAIEGEQREKVEYFFYKSCAEVLAKKLIETNEIAKTYKMMFK